MQVDVIWPNDLSSIPPCVFNTRRPAGTEWNARILLGVHAASVLIGRGGKRIKQMQEDSGAVIQFWQDAKGLLEDERLVEVRGPPHELQDGLDVFFSELNRVPEALAPRYLQLLVPDYTINDCLLEAQNVQGAAAFSADRLVCDHERLLVISGDVRTRLTAALMVSSFLARKLWKPGQQPLFSGSHCKPEPSYQGKSTPASISQQPLSASQRLPVHGDSKLEQSQRCNTNNEGNLHAPSNYVASEKGLNQSNSSEHERKVATVVQSTATPAAQSQVQTTTTTSTQRQDGNMLPTNQRQSSPFQPHLHCRPLEFLLPFSACNDWFKEGGYFSEIARVFGVYLEVCEVALQSERQLKVRLFGDLISCAVILVHVQCHMSFRNHDWS